MLTSDVRTCKQLLWHIATPPPSFSSISPQPMCRSLKYTKHGLHLFIQECCCGDCNISICFKNNMMRQFSQVCSKSPHIGQQNLELCRGRRKQIMFSSHISWYESLGKGGGVWKVVWEGCNQPTGVHWETFQLRTDELKHCGCSWGKVPWG